MTGAVSPRRRREVIDALRRGTVPANGLDLLAVGLDRFAPTVDDELATVTGGSGGFKAIRGDYGSGKTFLTRWIAERARRLGMATAEVQVSETETPLHRLETVYRRIAESLTTAAFPPSALRPVLDGWIYTLQGDVSDGDGSAGAVDALMERRLAAVSVQTPIFAQAMRAYHHASTSGDLTVAEGLLAWLSGQPQVAAAVKRQAGVRGDLDHFGAMGFLQGLLAVLRDSGHPGLLVVLDEVETLQRARSDVRDKALNALRQLIDEVDSGRFPGLYVVITGTPAFFDGPSGVPRLPPLAARIATDFSGQARFDNPRAVQIRLPGFDRTHLVELGRKVRDLYAAGAPPPSGLCGSASARALAGPHNPRVAALVDDEYLALLADAVAGPFGDRVGVVPRLYLKKLIDVLDRVDLHADYDPRQHYRLTVVDTELTAVEREARAAVPVDDGELTALEREARGVLRGVDDVELDL